VAWSTTWLVRNIKATNEGRNERTKVGRKKGT
jgi:hypothetical protein